MSVPDWVLRHGPLPQEGTLASQSGSSHRFDYRVVTNTTTALVAIDLLYFIKTQYGHYVGSAYTKAYGTESVTLFCSSVNAIQESDGKLWTVTATYSAATPLSQNDDPTQLPWDIAFSHASSQTLLQTAWAKWNKRLVIGATGDTAAEDIIPPPATSMTVAVLNSKGDVYDPSPEHPRRNLQIRLSKNYTITAFNNLLPLNYDDTINSVDYRIANINVPAYSGLLNVEANRQFYRNRWGQLVYYMALSFTVSCNQELWVTRLLDQGLRHKKYAAPNKDTTVAAMAAGRQDRGDPTPILLNGGGYALSDYNGDTNVPNKLRAVFNCYLVYYPMVWDPLGLPATVSE